MYAIRSYYDLPSPVVREWFQEAFWRLKGVKYNLQSRIVSLHSGENSWFETWDADPALHR